MWKHAPPLPGRLNIDVQHWVTRNMVWRGAGSRTLRAVGSRCLGQTSQKDYLKSHSKKIALELPVTAQELALNCLEVQGFCNSMHIATH